MKKIHLFLSPKVAKDSRLTVRVPKSVRAMADEMAETQPTSLAAVVEAGIKLLYERMKDEKKKS